MPRLAALLALAPVGLLIGWGVYGGITAVVPFYLQTPALVAAAAAAWWGGRSVDR